MHFVLSYPSTGTLYNCTTLHYAPLTSDFLIARYNDLYTRCCLLWSSLCRCCPWLPFHRVCHRINSSSSSSSSSKMISPWGHLMMFSNSLLPTWILTLLRCKSSRFSPSLESSILSNSLWILVPTVRKAMAFFTCWMHTAMLPSTVSRLRIRIESPCLARTGSF
jgi:hypothetical protein